MTGCVPKPRNRTDRQKGASTIADVATLAGVSPMTVSRVINGETNVRSAMRDKVEKAISELDYLPNRAAQRLAGAAGFRLGLLYSNPSAAYLSEFLVGSLDQAGRSDVQLVVKRYDESDAADIADWLVRGGIDGVLLPPPLCDSPHMLDSLAAANMPVVAVATSEPRKGMGSVSIDDRAAARAMTAHLLDLGHARIGFIKGHSNLNASAERLSGYRDALAAANVPFDETLVVEGLFTYRSGLDAAEELLDLSAGPSAIFASNDDMAAAAVAVAHRRGLDVPGDLTVCGFDDSALATTIWPELTTIRQPIAEMARSALVILVQLLRDHRPAHEASNVKFDYVLIRRQSDAPPR